MWKKDIVFGSDAREKFLSGVNKVGMYVGSTMGPAGKNWILQQKFKSPQIHNDGVEVARHIFLEDPMEDLAAQTMVDIAMHTNQEVGDGTTTSVVIADALITRGFKETELSEHTGTSSVQIAEEIYKEGAKVLEKLNKQSKKLKKDDLYKVVSTALRDWEIGKKIADMLDKVGVNGRISVEENWETKRGTEFEVVRGMKFLGKMVSPYFANDKNGKEGIWKDALVLVTNEKIESLTAIAKLTSEIREKGKTTLVILNGYSEGAASYSKKFTTDLLRARFSKEALMKKGIELLDVLPLEMPSLTTEQLKDICIYLKARFIGDTRALSDAKYEDLGTCHEIASVNDGYIHLMGGKGDTSIRIEELKKQLELEQDVMFQGKIRDRIASLAASQGKIRVGSPTEAEQTYRKEKIVDAINAGKAAMDEGVIKGGGIPFRDIAEELGKDHILYEALRAPFETIQRNAGGKLVVGEHVLDAVKVSRLALENALSAGAQLIATGGGICDRRETLVDAFERLVKKAITDPEVDFRDESNRDRGLPLT